MANAYSLDELLEFLDHAGDKGLMPAATAQALAVASRNVMGVLNDQEKRDLGSQDLDSVIKRFMNKRAKDFSPASLKEYGRRVHRAVDHFLRWREDPSSFSVRTRTTKSSRRKVRDEDLGEDIGDAVGRTVGSHTVAGTYHTSVPVRQGLVVTLANIPQDLSKAEADKIATFVRMLAIGA